jgi:hypothetical protein
VFESYGFAFQEWDKTRVDWNVFDNTSNLFQKSIGLDQGGDTTILVETHDQPRGMSLGMPPAFPF